MKHGMWVGTIGFLAVASVLTGGCSTGLRVTKDLGTVPGDTGAFDPDAPTNFEPGENPNPGNGETPVADAGEDIVAEVSSEVFLDGSNSFDPNGDPLTYTWVLQQTPPSSKSFLINETRVQSSLFLDRPGSYLVELAVSDGFESSRDTVEIIAEVVNSGPVAVAGPDQDVVPGETVVLSGADSYDPDGQPITFEWELTTVPPASSASLSSPTSSLTTFVADRSGTYIAELVVSDGEESSPPDIITIRARESGSGGSSGGCLSCSRAPNLTGGGIASAFGLFGLPLLGLWWSRRRDH